MADISYSINSTAANALLSRAPGLVSFAMRGGMEDATTFELARMKHYPTQRQGSAYKRTHILEKSWSRRITGSGLNIVGIIGSNGAMAPYNRVVQDRDRQARIHQGRWQTIQDVAEHDQPRVQRFFEDRIQAAMR